MPDKSYDFVPSRAGLFWPNKTGAARNIFFVFQKVVTWPNWVEDELDFLDFKKSHFLRHRANISARMGGL